jgi:hypothetical protein
MTTAEACDLLIAMTTELVEARRDRDSYRTLAQQALQALHDLQQSQVQQQARYRALLDELRQLRHQRAMPGRAA